MLENAAGTARQLTERNTGAEPDLNLAIPNDYFIVPMPQSQLMCTTRLTWGVLAVSSAQLPKQALRALQLSTDCRQTCSLRKSAKLQEKQEWSRSETSKSPSFRCAVDTMNSLVLFAR